MPEISDALATNGRRRATGVAPRHEPPKISVPLRLCGPIGLHPVAALNVSKEMSTYEVTGSDREVVGNR